MTKFEYLTALVDTHGQYKYKLSEEWKSVNELGAEGWELAAIDSAEEEAWAWFKRPKEQGDA